MRLSYFMDGVVNEYELDDDIGLIEKAGLAGASRDHAYGQRFMQVFQSLGWY